MKKEEEKYSKSYINTLIKHSKGVPDSRKYSKIIKWCDINTTSNNGKDGISAGKFGTEEKVTLFAKMGKEGRNRPGPTTYNDDKVKDNCVLRRTLGTYKR